TMVGTGRSDRSGGAGGHRADAGPGGRRGVVPPRRVGGGGVDGGGAEPGGSGGEPRPVRSIAARTALRALARLRPPRSRSLPFAGGGRAARDAACGGRRDDPAHRAWRCLGGADRVGLGAAQLGADGGRTGGAGRAGRGRRTRCTPPGPLGQARDGGGMSTLVAVDGVLYDLESSTEVPDGVTALVGEPERDDEARADPEPRVE